MGDKENPEGEGQKGEEPHPATPVDNNIESAPPADTSSSAPQKEKQTSDQSILDAALVRWTKVIGAFTIVLAVAAVVSDIIISKQLGEMSDAGKQTDRIIAADDRLAKAMENSVTQAQTAFDAANKQAILTQRAWVYANIETIPHKEFYTEGEHIAFRVTIMNSGRTPATNMRVLIDEGTLGSTDKIHWSRPEFKYTEGKYAGYGVMTPTQIQYRDFPIGYDSRWFDAIRQSIIQPLLYGRIEYNDVFGNPHWITFCSKLLATRAWAACEYYNETDKN